MAIVVAVVESRVCRMRRRSRGERQRRVNYETEMFGRHAGHYGFGGREGERGVDYFRGLLRETYKKEFSFRGIESKRV